MFFFLFDLLELVSLSLLYQLSLVGLVAVIRVTHPGHVTPGSVLKRIAIAAAIIGWRGGLILNQNLNFF